MIFHADVSVLGLSLGVTTMKKGEFSRFLLAPQYAYGTMGCPPTIPPSAVILYEVHIIDFFNTGQMDSFVSLSPVGRRQTKCHALFHLT